MNGKGGHCQALQPWMILVLVAPYQPTARLAGTWMCPNPYNLCCLGRRLDVRSLALAPNLMPTRLSPFSNSELHVFVHLPIQCTRTLHKVSIPTHLPRAVCRIPLGLAASAARFRQGRAGSAQTLKFPPIASGANTILARKEVHNPQTSSSTSLKLDVIIHQHDHKTSAPTTARTTSPFDFCWPVESSFGAARRCARREPALGSVEPEQSVNPPSGRGATATATTHEQIPSLTDDERSATCKYQSLQSSAVIPRIRC